MINKIKHILYPLYERYIEYKKYSTKYCIEGNIKNSKHLLYVLGGYKPYLWNDVFSRIRRFQIDDMDVCIVSSGKYCKGLSDICKQNDWVYISTSLNNVCVISNVIMRIFKDADYIFKLDEDIYIPKDYFYNMLDAYEKIKNNEPVEVGYICPSLPLGFYGMHDFLLKTDSLNDYEQRFGKHRIGGSVLNPCFRSGEGVDEFIWEKIGVFDKCAEIYQKDGLSYEACISRSGIAAILFKRQFWNNMGGLKRGRGIGVGDTGDEGQITAYCALHFQITYCVKNVLVGHFAFGGAENQVLKLKERHPEYFELNSEENNEIC